MPGRFTLAIPDIKQVAEATQASVRSDEGSLYRKRYNIAPTQRHWIVIQRKQERLVVPATWGWSQQKGLLINLRTETVLERDYYLQQLLHNRCLIPADGFYEWGGEKGAKIPFWFHSADRSLLFFAGIYWERNGERYFAILTKEPEPPVAAIHDRMGVFVAKDSFELWWSAPELFLRAIPKANLQAYRVSPRVNSTNVDDSGCIVPDSEENFPEPQYGLF